MVSHPLILKRLEETGHLLEEGTPFYQALTDSKLYRYGGKTDFCWFSIWFGR